MAANSGSKLDLEDPRRKEITKRRSKSIRDDKSSSGKSSDDDTSSSNTSSDQSEKSDLVPDLIPAKKSDKSMFVAEKSS